MLTTVAINENSATLSKLPLVETAASETAIAPQASRVIKADVLVQLRSNLAQLEDLHGRLKFVLSEVSYLLKKE